MYTARRTIVATSMAAVMAVAGVTAAIAADPAPAPPPKIAFLANGIVPADALAAGPIAGQLGAPVYTTHQDTLPAGTATALDDYDPELVVVMGGPVAISDTVVNQVSAATGLPTVAPSPVPASGVVRAAGGDRFETATIVADLLAAYAPAYLPVDLQAVDADLLDGKDSTEFLGKAEKAADAELLDGQDSAAFQSSLLWAMVDSDGTIVAQSGGISTISSGGGGFYLDFGQSVQDRPIMAMLRYANTGGESNGDGEITAGVCGTTNVFCFPAGTNNPEHVYVLTQDSAGSAEARPFYITLAP